jgi:DNA polymerase I-like protein with 3'-5' exonuclease and polymerase domains
MEMALLPVVVAMEQHGFPVDAEKLKAFGKSMRAEADAIAADLRVKLGVPLLNVNSTQQVVTAFKGVGVEIDATNKEILTGLNHPFAVSLLAYREKDNLAGKVVSLLKHVQADGRIHARFNSLGTETGRFSSSKPNLQQIPGIRHTLEFRACFIPSGSARKLIVADANQVELRRAAAISKDLKMIAAFRANEDLHRKTAAAVLDKTAEEVNNHDRTLAKSVNFGFIYGQGAKGYRRYAKTDYGLDVGEDQAVKLRTAFFNEYAGLALWHSEAWQKAHAGESEARTVMGRRLVARKDDEWSRFNVHTNFVVQGDCAEYQKLCMVNLARALSSDAHIIATVHDEVIIDVPADQAEHCCTLIRTVMEDTWFQLFGDEIPIKVDGKICDSWSEK